MLASFPWRASAEVWRGVSMPCFFFGPAAAGDDATASAPASTALTTIRFMTISWLDNPKRRRQALRDHRAVAGRRRQSNSGKYSFSATPMPARLRSPDRRVRSARGVRIAPLERRSGIAAPRRPPRCRAASPAATRMRVIAAGLLGLHAPTIQPKEARSASFGLRGTP